ncbi:MAG: prolyl oligopeptidase family serine peptidase [Acidobacteriota bacterium]
MRHLLRTGVLACVALSAGLLGSPAAGQGAAPVGPSAQKPGFLTVPPNVTAVGLPPIPASLPDTLAPYASSRRALLLDWHPTRREVLIATAFGNTYQIHSVAGPGMDRQQLTFFPDGVTAATVGAWYEPGGSYFIFNKDTGGGAETLQLFRYTLATRQITLLTDGKSRNGQPTWSHRAGLIAFTSTRRNGIDRDIYVMDPLQPLSARLVSPVDGTWSVVSWSPDDRELIAMNSPSASETHLWLLDVNTGARKPLSPVGEASIWRGSQYSADGRFVYAISNHQSELSRLWQWSRASGAWRLVTGEEDSVESFRISPDGKTIAVVYDSNASSARVELLDAATGSVRATPKLPPGQLVGYPQWRPGGSEVAFTLWSLRNFGDVYSVNARTGLVERWTHSEPGPFDPESLPEAEIVQWKSFDGLIISGVLYRPPARFTGPRPVMLSIHGGPSGTLARERPRYQGRSAYFLNELGIAILYPNVRGSFGFGKAFAKLDDGVKRVDAVKDVGALLDWIATQPEFDKNRVMVTGSSYGGYMTYAVAEAYSDRLRCALAASAISDFITYFQGTDPTRPEDRRAEYGDERVPEMREFLTRLSPITDASKLRIPLMIVHGAKDTRVPVSQAEEMAARARANGVPVWLTTYEDEGHLFPTTTANNNFFFYTWIEFVREYLLN